MSSKKKNTLSMGERLSVLNDLNTLSLSAVATKYNVHPTTIWRIQNNAANIMKFSEKGRIQQKRRVIRTSTYESLEQSLMSWVMERKTVGNSVNDVMLMEKAKELRDSMGLPSDFKVSKGWLDGFKKRRDLHFIVDGESASADEDSAKKFCDDFEKLLNEDNIHEDNIYNMYKTGLLWKALPAKALAEENGKPPMIQKKRKERITVALCTNATGTHKLIPLVVNKFENPRALKHSKDALPVVFKSQENASLTQALFSDWYENIFKPSAQAHQTRHGIPGKIVLLLDICECRTVSTDLLNEDGFKIIFFPPNSTRLIQPMAESIIPKFKALYRKKTVRNASTYEGGINKYQKEATLNGCIEVLHESWVEITVDNIIDSWKKIFPHQTNPYYRVMKQELTNLTGDKYTEEDIRDFMSSCEEEEKKRFSEEDDEETRDADEILQYTETPEEKRNRKEEMRYLFECLEERMVNELPVIKNMLSVVKNHVLDTNE